MQVLASTAEDDVKCIFASKYLRFGVFTVTFWFHFWFHFMIIFLPNIKNDPKMKSKMSRKSLKNGYREQP